jgi:hypothetical protein
VLSLSCDLKVKARQQPGRAQQPAERDTPRRPVIDRQLTVAVLVHQVRAVPAARRSHEAAAQLVVPVLSATLTSSPNLAGYAEPHPARPVQQRSQLTDSRH